MTDFEFNKLKEEVESLKSGRNKINEIKDIPDPQGFTFDDECIFCESIKCPDCSKEIFICTNDDAEVLHICNLDLNCKSREDYPEEIKDILVSEPWKKKQLKK